MLKNKYVLGVLIGIAIFTTSAIGGILVMNHGAKSQQTNLSQATSDDNSGSGQPITLSQDSMSGPQISANTNAGSSLSSGNSASGSDAAKLLDPTTFSQYDKYKDAQNASYVDLQVGTGAAVTVGSQVTVIYKGWLTNGTLFDESKVGSDGKVQAFSFVEGQHQVIPGWESALDGAKVGGVRLLVVPPAVGYGAQGQGPIPGNAVLIFQVQVVQVK